MRSAAGSTFPWGPRRGHGGQPNADRMNKEIESLKRKEDGLIDEQVDVEQEIIYQVGNII